MKVYSRSWWEALLVVLGTAGMEWAYYHLDKPEWENERYAHQN